jgi:hypothetical protein
MTEQQLQGQIASPYAAANQSEDYSQESWLLSEFDSNSQQLSSIQTYLSQLRTDNKQQNTLEQTGIHNYGRLYSNNNMTLISNSVLHNNRGSLIYSNNNIDFRINNVLFNNAGGGVYDANSNCQLSTTNCQLTYDL